MTSASRCWSSVRTGARTGRALRAWSSSRRQRDSSYVVRAGSGCRGRFGDHGLFGGHRGWSLHLGNVGLLPIVGAAAYRGQGARAAVRAAAAGVETHPNTSAEVVEERVTARLARQMILDRDDPPPPMLWVLLDENVLTREVGGVKVMHDQLAHLAEVARRPNVTAQVILGVGAHPGLLGHS